MYKIFLTCRNRIAVTCKCLTALKKHSALPHQIYVWDNASNHKIEEHFMYWCMLYKAGLISQVCFTTEDSTFHAFSKASACNFFGLQHQQDPNKDNYDFILILDNDIIVTPRFDEVLKNAWDDVNKLGLTNIKVISQIPGGIRFTTELNVKIADVVAYTGKLGGSGLWCVRPNFFSDVGLLDLSKLVGFDNKDDQMYWKILEERSGGKDYILGLKYKLAMHCGGLAGSVCNVLTKNRLNKNKLDLIKFEELDQNIDSMSFDEFYDKIINNPHLIGW